MNQKTLVSTAIEETWTMNNSTVFLGEWCKIFNRKDIWGKINHEVIGYHWNKSEKLIKDIEYIERLIEELTNDLSKSLNFIHNKNYSNQYWKILCGHWLSLFCHSLFDRWETVESALSKKDNYLTNIINIDHSEMVPENIESFVLMCHQDKWNHYIFSEILSSDFFKEKLTFKNIDKIKNDTFSKNPYHPLSPIKKLILNLLKFLNPITSLIRKKQKYLICESYLGKKNEILLNLSLGLLPLTVTPRYQFDSIYDENIRNRIHLSFKPKNNFEKFLIDNLIKHVPLAFIENYKNVLNYVENINWPQNPKVIFTSHFIDNKTIGSLYTAEKKEKGAKLIHGQHGGAYGQNLFHWYESFERSISDKYLTWGWKDYDDKKIVPLGILKTLNEIKKIKYKNNNKIIMIIRPKERYSSTALDTRSRGPQLKKYHEDCLKIGSLIKNTTISKNLIVRLHERKYGWCEEQLWNTQFPDIEIDKGHSPVIQTLQKAKIIIYTYNATGYLELMASNFPVLLQWNVNENINRESCNKFFKELEDVKIFHKTPESLTNHLISINNNVEEWWKSTNTQLAVKNFCNNFAKIESNKIKKIRDLIKNYDN